MAQFNRSDELQNATFSGVNLRGARFVESDLSDVVMRGVELHNVDIDAPWLPEGGGFRINGVDVTAFVEAELNRRFPGRSERQAEDPGDLRAAWEKVERAWTAALERVATMPADTVDVSVAGEWSFSQTLRHLVFATDLWLGHTVLEAERPVHAIGQPDTSAGDDPGPDHSLTADSPPFTEVLEARADRVAMVRDFIAAATPDELAVTRTNPHNADRPETTLSCLHTILKEEWEHLRFAVRDLDAIAAKADA